MQDASLGPVLRLLMSAVCPRPPPPASSEPNLLVRACNQLGQFLQHRGNQPALPGPGEHVCTGSPSLPRQGQDTHHTVINALQCDLWEPVLATLTWSVAPLPLERLRDPVALVTTAQARREPRARSTYPFSDGTWTSVRARRLDLLYAMHWSNAKQIASEMCVPGDGRLRHS